MENSDAFSQIGQRLRYLRKYKELSIEQMGALVGKSSKTISRWENGTGSPDFFDLELFAEALKADLYWIITGEEDKNGASINGPIPIENTGEGTDKIDPGVARATARAGVVLHQKDSLPSENLVTPTRKLLEGVLMDDLHGLGEKIPEMTDDEIVEMASAIRKALGKIKK